jgi:glyoxylase-like metal-dependent hydrolase (beta-lactamase superfamily II)
MILEQLVVGQLGTNCYLVGCPETRQGLVIDPGGEGRTIAARIRNLQLKVKRIILTHGHIDHWAGAGEVVAATGAPISLHREDAPLVGNPEASLAAFLAGPQVRLDVADDFLEDGAVVEVGRVKLRVLHTPGHTPGGICLYGAGIVFTGDTLFEGSIGRTDFPGGNLRQLIATIREKLLVLPDDTEVCPGHGPRTTIGYERRYNPYLTEVLD